MAKRIVIDVDEDIYEKFIVALKLTGESENSVLNEGICRFISDSFGTISKEFSVKEKKQDRNDINEDFKGKALQRIPLWASRPNQYNHKIIKAYFEAMRKYGKATIGGMELLCSNRDDLSSYVPTFRTNYAQMKFDGEKSNGKVFEDDGENVWIWSEIEDVLMKYKDFFK